MEFYEKCLKTDGSVSRRRSGLNLGHFWPRQSGEEQPIVFCQVEGDEESGHFGNTKVDPHSIYNLREAEKIVSKNNCQHNYSHQLYIQTI